MKTTFYSSLRSTLSVVTAIAVLAVSLYFAGTAPAHAAALTSISDVMTDATISRASNHTITFTTPTGVTDTQNFTITFPAGFNMASVVEDDVDVSDDATDLTTAADCTGAEQAGVSVAGQVLTVEICTGDGGAIAGGSVVVVEIGTNATASGTGANQITNHGTASASDTDYTVSIGGTMADSGSFVISILNTSEIAITATVAPTLSFALSTNAIDFGNLAVANARWATSGAGSGGSATDTAAFTMTIATNATSGYIITYNAPTLTSGTDTITVASITDDADGTPGTEQFGCGYSTAGDATIAAGYDHNATAGNRDWAHVASTTTTIVSETGPTNSEVISGFCLANIASNTEAGSYSTTQVMVATATF